MGGGLVAAVLLAWGLPFGALAPPPAPEGETFWTSEERPVRLRLLTPAQGQTGQGIFLMAAVPLKKGCEYGGGLTRIFDPQVTASPPAGPPERYRAHVWRRHGVPCGPGVRIVERPIHLETREPGTYRFVSGESAIVAVKVSGRAPKFPDQSEAKRCRFDAECWVTDVCVPSKQRPAELGICGEICGDTDECHDNRCDHGAGIVGICRDRIAECDARHPCGLGQACRKDGRLHICAWPSPPPMWSQRECETDRACAPDRFCVRQDAGAARGRCQALCGAGLPSCPDDHECSGRGVCEPGRGSD